MNEGDFEIAGNTYGRSEGVFVERVKPGAAGWRVQDSLNPVGDNRYFGRDHLSPPTWGLSFGTNGRTTDEALEALGALARVWNKPIREPGAELVLRYRINGRTRRLYGRPRGFDYDPNRTLRQGYVPASAAFVTSDTLHYADEAQQAVLTLLPGESGSHTLPATLPFTFVSGGPRSGLIPDVGGDADAPVEIVVHGPVVNPEVTVGGHRVLLNQTLAYDEWVTVDTRKMTVLQNNGASLGGKLSRRTFLADVRLSPGPSEVVFNGSDPTGTSTCTVTWRSAFHGF